MRYCLNTKRAIYSAHPILILDKKHERAQSCPELLARYSAEGNDFLFRIRTDDESFLCYYDPESKQSSKE